MLQFVSHGYCSMFRCGCQWFVWGVGVPGHGHGRSLGVLVILGVTVHPCMNLGIDFGTAVC